LLFISLGMAACFLSSDLRSSSPSRLLMLTVFALPALWFIGPAAESLVYMGSVFVTPACLAIVIVFGATILPQMALSLSVARWRFPAISAAAGLGLVVIGLSTNGFSKAHPRENGVCYALDLDRHQAYWASGDRSLDSWTSQVFKPNDRGTLEEFFPGWRTIYFKAPAPLADIQGPKLDTLEDHVVSGVRTLRLRVTSLRRVPEMELALSGPERFWGVKVDGRELPDTKGSMTLRFDVFPRSGSIELVFKTTPGPVLAARIKETTYSLADAPGFRPRRADMVRRPNTLDWFEGNYLKGDVTFVIQTFQLALPNGERARTH
jgi:hypothetical protein